MARAALLASAAMGTNNRREIAEKRQRDEAKRHKAAAVAERVVAIILTEPHDKLAAHSVTPSPLFAERDVMERSAHRRSDEERLNPCSRRSS